MDRARRPQSRPPDDGAHLQPDVDNMMEKWLVDAEFDRANGLLERLGGDEQLLLRLQLSEFADDDWEPVGQELARYGLAVITSWVRKRTIYTKVKQRTGYGLPTLENWPVEEHTVTDLADDTVVEALNYFKNRVLIPGKWDPTKGASLRTFFIGQCLYKFANCYRRLYEGEVQRRTSEYIVDDETMALFTSSVRGIEDSVITNSEVRDAMRLVSTTKARIALMMSAQGYRYDEIADRLGLVGGAKAVENMITYQKKKARKSS